MPMTNACSGHAIGVDTNGESDVSMANVRSLPFILANAAFYDGPIIECGYDPIRTPALLELCRLKDTHLHTFHNNKSIPIESSGYHTIHKQGCNPKSWSKNIRPLESSGLYVFDIGYSGNRILLKSLIQMRGIYLVYEIDNVKTPEPWHDMQCDLWSLEVVEGVGRIIWEE